MLDLPVQRTRVLMLHNRYVQSGGEDVEFEEEVALLRNNGHAVRVEERSNVAISVDTLQSKARLFAQTLWSVPSFRATREGIRQWRPDVVHVHNFLPLLSPSVYYAAWAEGVPVVQSLHNYRLICPGSLLMRNGRLCEDCVGRSAWRGAIHACYRGSHLSSLAVAAMLQSHRALHTWQRVEAYIALSDFQRAKLVAGGLPGDRVHVKSNCVAWDYPIRSGPGAYALFVGRLSPEKGVQTLVESWIRAGRDGVAGLPLKLVGSGPLGDELCRRIEASEARIELLGHRSRSEVARLLVNARYLVYPSELYEPLGISVLEAFAAGVPVLASRIGALAQVVEAGRTGAHFRAGDPQDLLRAALDLGQDQAACERMGRAAREAYLAQYTPAHNYRQLVEIYKTARERRARAESH